MSVRVAGLVGEQRPQVALLDDRALAPGRSTGAEGSELGPVAVVVTHVLSRGMALAYRRCLAHRGGKGAGGAVGQGGRLVSGGRYQLAAGWPVELEHGYRARATARPAPARFGSRRGFFDEGGICWVTSSIWVTASEIWSIPRPARRWRRKCR